MTRVREAELDNRFLVSPMHWGLYVFNFLIAHLAKKQQKLGRDIGIYEECRIHLFLFNQKRTRLWESKIEYFNNFFQDCFNKG